MAHYCIGSPCKICFPDPIFPMPTAQSPYIPYIKLDEDNAKVAEINRQEKKQPNLGLATTQELLEELMARARVGGYDQNRTVDPQ